MQHRIRTSYQSTHFCAFPFWKRHVLCSTSVPRDFVLTCRAREGSHPKENLPHAKKTKDFKNWTTSTTTPPSGSNVPPAAASVVTLWNNNTPTNWREFLTHSSAAHYVSPRRYRLRGSEDDCRRRRSSLGNNYPP